METRFLKKSLVEPLLTNFPANMSLSLLHQIDGGSKETCPCLLLLQTLCFSVATKKRKVPTLSVFHYANPEKAEAHYASPATVRIINFYRIAVA